MEDAMTDKINPCAIEVRPVADEDNRKPQPLHHPDVDEIAMGQPTWLHIELMTDPELCFEDGEEPGWAYSVSLGDKLFSVWIDMHGKATVNEQ